MSEDSLKTVTLTGTVQDGVIVPDNGVKLPQGYVYELKQLTLEFTPEERAEFDAWERASDEAFQMILDLETEDRNESR